jgi:hypothetical protein
MQQPVGMRDGSNLQFLVVRMHKVAQIIQCETMRKRNKSSFHSSKIAMQTDTDGASSQIYWNPQRCTIGILGDKYS